ncbi:cysteine protease ATG4D-like isoform X2 [Eriocheir sinensis]|nr:cysteine protease ATG4D-like isoform X2 [Eriocheir sinensis]
MAAKGVRSPQSPVTLGQECTEGLLWSGPGVNFVADHFTEHPQDLPLAPQKHPGQRGGKVTRVKLTKSPSPTKEPTKFFVLPAGGMSVPVPELDTQPTPRGSKGSLGPRPAPEGREGSFSGGGHLPLGVELVAGRSQMSAPDGSRGGSTWSKVKSLPPSHTLAMSASLLKSYFTSSSSSSNSSSSPSSSTTSSSTSPATEKQLQQQQQQQHGKGSAVTPDTETSVKTKMIGLWNNVKYGWTVNLKTNFSRDSPVYLLGSVYHKSLGADGEDADQGEVERHGMEAFKRHFHTLVWCTYRRQFPTLQDSSLTTDCGWGCMLRSGQMMIATALIRHFLGPEWRHDKKHNDVDSPQELVHRSIIRWFGDSPSPHCPLSLHNLVHLGHKLGKRAGDWYGPASVAYIFKEAIEMGSKYILDLQHVCVYVAQDCAVYIQDVLDLCSAPCLCNVGSLYKTGRGMEGTREGAALYPESLPNLTAISETSDTNSNGNKSTSNGMSGCENRQQGGSHIPQGEARTPNALSGDALCPKCDNWKAVVIMVPVRLGGETLNPIYAPCIYSLFTHDLCVGIIGGRPKHSLYFVGFQEESLIHLDPHLCQDAVAVTQAVFSPSSYHCSSPRKMALSRMDPSATLGFYCQTRTQFLQLMEELPELLTPKEPGFEYPIFEFVDGCCPDADACTRQVSTENKLAASLPPDTPLLPQDSEEFVFL